MAPRRRIRRQASSPSAKVAKPKARRPSPAGTGWTRKRPSVMTPRVPSLPTNSWVRSGPVADRGRVPAGPDDPAVGQHHLEADDHVLDLPVAVRVLAGPPAGQPAAHRRQVHRLGPVAEGEAVLAPQPGLHVGAEGAGPQVDDQRRRRRPSPMPASPHRSRATPAEHRDRGAAHPAAAAGRRSPAPGPGGRGPAPPATWAVSVGRATTAGRAGTSPVAAHPMASGHQSRPASARSASARRRPRHRRRDSRRRRASSTATRRPAEAVGDLGRSRRRSAVTGVGLGHPAPGPPPAAGDRRPGRRGPARRPGAGAGSSPARVSSGARRAPA